MRSLFDNLQILNYPLNLQILGDPFNQTMDTISNSSLISMDEDEDMKQQSAKYIADTEKLTDQIKKILRCQIIHRINQLLENSPSLELDYSDAETTLVDLKKDFLRKKNQRLFRYNDLLKNLAVQIQKKKQRRSLQISSLELQRLTLEVKYSQKRIRGQQIKLFDLIKNLINRLQQKIDTIYKDKYLDSDEIIDFIYISERPNQIYTHQVRIQQIRKTQINQRLQTVVQQFIQGESPEKKNQKKKPLKTTSSSPQFKDKIKIGSAISSPKNKSKFRVQDKTTNKIINKQQSLLLKIKSLQSNFQFAIQKSHPGSNQTKILDLPILLSFKVKQLYFSIKFTPIQFYCFLKHQNSKDIFVQMKLQKAAFKENLLLTQCSTKDNSLIDKLNDDQFKKQDYVGKFKIGEALYEVRKKEVRSTQQENIYQQIVSINLTQNTCKQDFNHKLIIKSLRESQITKVEPILVTWFVRKTEKKETKEYITFKAFIKKRSTNVL